MKYMSILVFISLVGSPAKAFVAYVGGDLGYSLTDIKRQTNANSGFEKSISPGFKVGLFFMDTFTVGFSATSWSNKYTFPNGDTSKASVIPYLIETNFFLDKKRSGLYFGANLGLTSVSIEDSVSGQRNTSSSGRLGYGGNIGYNFAIGESNQHFIGLQSRFLRINHDNPFNYLDFKLVYTYWWEFTK